MITFKFSLEAFSSVLPLHELSALELGLKVEVSNSLLLPKGIEMCAAQVTHKHVSFSASYAYTLQFSGLTGLQLSHHGPQFRTRSNICTLRQFIHDNKPNPLRSWGVGLPRSDCMDTYVSSPSCHF